MRSFSTADMTERNVIGPPGRYLIVGSETWINSDTMILRRAIDKERRECVSFNVSNQVQNSLPFCSNHVSISPQKDEIAYILDSGNESSIVIYSQTHHAIRIVRSDQT